VFATGFDHPIDVIDDHQSGLLVADYGSGTIYKISYAPEQNAATSAVYGVQNTIDSFLLETLLLGIAALAVLVVILRRPPSTTKLPRSFSNIFRSSTPSASMRTAEDHDYETVGQPIHALPVHQLYSLRK
jgi:hypothetical protein